jgi:hypothetical protein
MAIKPGDRAASGRMSVFDRARKTNDEAHSIIELERDGMRKKIARLRKLRLEKETEDALTVVEKPPVVKKSKAAAKKPKQPG